MQILWVISWANGNVSFKVLNFAMLLLFIIYILVLAQLGRLSNHGSPDRTEDNRSWQSAGGNNFNAAQQQDVEEVSQVNQVYTLIRVEEKVPPVGLHLQ